MKITAGYRELYNLLAASSGVTGFYNIQHKFWRNFEAVVYQNSCNYADTRELVIMQSVAK